MMKFQLALFLAGLGLAVDACVLPGEHGGAGRSRAARRLQRRGLVEAATGASGSAMPAFTEFPVGRGDRFGNLAAAPAGIGAAGIGAANQQQPPAPASLLNVDEISSGLAGLARAYGGDVELLRAPEPTVEGRPMHALAVGEARVLLLSGIHGRERGGPDYVLYLVADLLAARARGHGLRYGNASYTGAQVRAALSAGLVALPLANPDGVAYDQRTGSCWRKNRRPAADGRGVGVDLNRNFAPLWDYRRLFNLSADFVTPSSDDAASPLFHGPAPLSEPETRNVAWVLRRHRRRLAWFVDVHSMSGLVMYGWGDGDGVQTTDARQSFVNASYDGRRGVPWLGDDAADDAAPGHRYREYMEPDDLRAEKAAAERMAAAMARAGAVPYEALPMSWATASSGSAVDQARGPYYAHECGAARVHSLAVEFGGPSRSAACVLYPDAAAFHESMRQVSVGLMELLLTAAADVDGPKMREC